MILPVLLAAASAVSSDPFVQAIEVAQPVRLELTPNLDGNIAKEEWDPFGVQTYLQWEPGKIHIAGEAQPGKDLVLSIDGKGDGWLVGRDNIEFRVTVKDGKAVLSAQELDATAVKQPVWRERPDLEAASMAVVGANGNIEATFDDAGLGVLPKNPKDMSLRLDLADSTADSSAYLPRHCLAIRFDDHRSAALPEKMDSGVQAKTRSVVPGEDIRLRLTFHGTNKMGAKTIEMRSLGEAEDSANRMSLLFPGFDEKGRAFVDYRTTIDAKATAGFRVVRGTIAFSDGAPALVEASYRIAPVMDFSLLKTNFDRLPENNTIRVPYVLQMYTRQPADGLVRVAPPAGWQITKGKADGFSLLGNQMADARQLEFKVPADAHGTFPITFTGQTKQAAVTQVCFVTIR